MSDDVLQNVLEYMRDNIDEVLHVSAIASVAGVSPFHFSRTFRRLTGIPPAEYLREMRVSLAASLLENTEDPIAAIALECGFCDQPHLTRMFKLLRGVTPSEYRQSTNDLACG